MPAFGIVIALAIIAFWIRSQPGAPPIVRKLPFALVVLESWCFFAWLYGDKLRADNVDALLANISSEQGDYDQGLLICNASAAIAMIVGLIATVILIYGWRAVSAAKKKPDARE